MSSKKGILLINTGTPDALEIKEVKTYLKKFLMDEDIITIPKIFRYFLVNHIIVPKRSPESLKKYQSISARGISPLKIISQNLERILQKKFSDSSVKIAMRYSSPSIQHVIEEFKSIGITDITFVPLFPQFSRATTLSCIKEISKFHYPKSIISSFHNHPLFINSWVSNIRRSIRQDIDLILFSYHGLPKKFLDQGPYIQAELKKRAINIDKNLLHTNYKDQCLQTTKRIAEELKRLGIFNGPSITTFQSRLGRMEWIRPYTDQYLKENASHFKHILIVSPAFITDGLETLEELKIEAVNSVKGITKMTVAPSLNTQSEWVENFSIIIKEHIAKESQ